MERVASRTSFMDITKSQQQRRGSLVPLSPTQMLWSSENGHSCNKNDKDKGVSVQVVLRCRPLSEDETRAKTPVVVSCGEEKREVAVIQTMGNKQIDKTFSFDKVFGPTSKQKDLYDQVVAPIVKEALEGFNWTIFAYGQTGTGKTYTMEGGGGKAKDGEFLEDVGVIPRAVEQIFDTLEAQNAEYSMKVTFIELYNEEITDLLAPDDKSKKPIALMEDGKGAVFMRGLEEEMVCSADEIHRVLEKGSARKRTAETLVNTQSNRSHSLFTIMVQIKERTSDGEEVIKCGKLNLVDLAGSENVLRSGAREGRAREAGEINKSLLTLGRVINALVDHSGHVPYRDSKLTRLLRDSLGGKTKTCIIATVSPSIHSLEETLNTLDYAYRAKNIKNRPEVNQKVIKSAVIKELYTEINSLKQELHATREKNGIYIPHERYLNEEATKKEMTEKLELKNKELTDLRELLLQQQKLSGELSEKLKKTERKLEQSELEVFNLKDQWRQANETIKEKEYLIFNLLGSEKALTERAFELRAELANATSEVSSLLARIEHKNYIEDGNKVLIQSFQNLLAQHLGILHKTIAASVTQQRQQLKEIEEHTASFSLEKHMASEKLQTQLRRLKDVYGGGIKSLVELAAELNGTSEKAWGDINSEVVKHSSALEEFIREASVKAGGILDDLRTNLDEQEQHIEALLQEQHESRLRAYEMTRSASTVTINFFKSLSKDILAMLQSAEEARTTYDQKLNEFGRKFEEYADNEEQQLLDKVAELLASSNTRKKKLVQTEVDGIRDYIGSKMCQLHHGMSNMNCLTSSAQDEHTSFLGVTEKHYTEDANAIQRGRDCLTTICQDCTTKAGMVAEQWQDVHESLCSLQKTHIDSVDSVIKAAWDTNQTIHYQLPVVASSTQEAADVSQGSSLSSIEYLRKLYHDESEKINSLTSHCHEDMQDMEAAHSAKIVEITENAENCLINDYMVDDSLCSTPTKMPSNLPSMTDIEELRTPAFKELLNSFREAQSGKQENGDFIKFSFLAINGGGANDLAVQ